MALIPNRYLKDTIQIVKRKVQTSSMFGDETIDKTVKYDKEYKSFRVYVQMDIGKQKDQNAQYRKYTGTIFSNDKLDVEQSDMIIFNNKTYRITNIFYDNIFGNNKQTTQIDIEETK